MIASSVDSDPGVATILLNRPDKKNAMTPAMLTHLIAAVSSPPPAARVLILSGSGDTFCSGFDLSLCRDNSDALRELLTGLSHAIRALRALPIPVIAAVQGAAIAGGCALLGGADLTITHDSARFGYPVVRLGISPAVTAPFLSQSLGPGRTRERLLNPLLISGRDALPQGLAYECLADPSAVLPRARELAAALAAKPGGGAALAATKRWLNELDCSAGPAAADHALAVSLSLVGSPEERERLAAMWG